MPTIPFTYVTTSTTSTPTTPSTYVTTSTPTISTTSEPIKMKTLHSTETYLSGSRAKWYGQNGTDKMAPIESSINQAIQHSLTIRFSSLIPLSLRPISAYHVFVTLGC